MPTLINENNAVSPSRKKLAHTQRWNIYFACSWLEAAFAERMIDIDDVRDPWFGPNRHFILQSKETKTTIIVSIDPDSGEPAYSVNHLTNDPNTSGLGTHDMNSILSLLDTIAPLYQSAFGTIERENSQDRWGNKISLIRIPSPPVPGKSGKDILTLTMATLPSRNRTVTRKRINYAPEGSPRLSLDVRSTEPDNDTIPSTLVIGPYTLSWGDGDFLGCTQEPGIPALDLTRIATSNGYSSTVITDVVRQMLPNTSLWTRKD